jgi:hypothetical protein
MSDQLFERALRDWLEDGSDRTPPTAIKAVLLAAKTTPQERVLRIPRRLFPMPTSLRLVAVIAIIAVLGVGALSFLGDGPNIGPPPAQTIAPTQSAETVAFTSPLYGYSVDRSATWEVTPATVQWPAGTVNTGTNPEWFDVFSFDPVEGAVGFVGVGAQPIPDGMTADAWMRAYAELQAASDFACKGPADDWVDATVGTLAIRRLDAICIGEMSNGEIATNQDAAHALFVVDGRGYVITGNPDGVRSLLSSFQPGPPSPAPTETNPTSSRLRPTEDLS